MQPILRIMFTEIAIQIPISLAKVDDLNIATLPKITP